MHVVCRWMGNSKLVASKHYLQLTDDHFRTALGEAAQNAAHSENEAAQNAAQPLPATKGNEQQKEKPEVAEDAELVGACSDPQDDSQSCNKGEFARDRSRTCTPFGTGT